MVSSVFFRLQSGLSCYAENAICYIDDVITTVKSFQGRSRGIANIIKAVWGAQVCARGRDWLESVALLLSVSERDRVDVMALGLGHILVGNGSFLPLTSLVLSDKNEANVPVCEGRVGDTPVRVLRDTGCSSVVVKDDLVPEKDKLKEYATLILADGTVRIFQRAMVDVYTPYLCGRVKAFCMKTPVYDLITGNVEGARNADAPDPHWNAERCAVTTRRQAKTEGQNIPLKLAEEVDLAVINPEKLKQLQEADPTLYRYRNKEEPVMMRGKEIAFVTRKGILYRQCETQADEKLVLQVVVPGCLRRQIMQLAYDSILGAHTGTDKTLSRIQAVF